MELAAKPVLLQGAMNEEVSLFLERIGQFSERTVDGFPFWEGEYRSVPVIVSRTYMGKVNAALATVLAIKTFSPGLVINQGTAGAHKEKFNVGDIIVGSRYINYDSTRSVSAKGSGDGYSWLNKRLKLELYDGRQWTDCAGIFANQKLVDIASGLKNTGGNVFAGTVATGDGFSREHDAIRDMSAAFGSDCEEMETFAAAQVCQHYSVPFIGVRVISNNELRGIPFDEDSCGICQDFCLNLTEKAAYLLDLE